jgi:arabinofuranosyltransferase
MVRQLRAVDRFRSALSFVGGMTATLPPFVAEAAPDDEPRRVSTLQPADRARELVPLLTLCLYAVVIVKAGWLADDAFASFRAASNLVNGYGLVSNPPERVQAFTNPLWTLLFALAYWPTKNAYAVGIVMGLVSSLATVAVIAFSRRVDVLPRALAVLTLGLSQAFVDFSTSGLENPLSHLLLVVIYVSARRERSSFVIALLSAFLAFNRLDHLLLVAPLLAWRLAQSARHGFSRELGWMALGFVPLALWELFAIVYYGFPLPNTAYSKLNASIGTWEFVSQGLWYFVESASRDPLTPLVLFAGVAAPFATRKWQLLPFSLGIALYLAYVLRVGGDFMAGRFFTAPLVLAVVLLFHDVVPGLPPRLDLAVGALVILVPLAANSSPLAEPAVATCPIPESGVADERSCYRAHTGLIANVRTAKYKKHEYYELGVAKRKKGEAVVAENVVGLEAFAAGPKVHLVDRFALTEPLLARIPYEPDDKNWRIGHFLRALPDGYLESVKTGRNRIKDPCIRRFNERLRRVTHGPIFSWQRVKDIAWLNFVERTATACPKRPSHQEP